MKAWMMALIAGRARLLKTAGPYTANATFVVPATTSKLETISGKGADGTPSSSGSYLVMVKRRWTQIYYANGTSEDLDYPGSIVLVTPVSSFEPTPPPYCDAQTAAGGSYPSGTMVAYCYNYTRETVNFSNPATTGASTTAFGKIFPGGVGGPAPLTTFNDVAVISGSSNSLAVPSGGTLTFTYYE